MGRPKTKMIDRQVAVKTALEIIDAEGLEAFSMRRLAEQLGVNVASLYYHFESKVVLLRAVSALIVYEAPLPRDDLEDWTDLMVTTTVESHKMMMRHPNALPLFAQFPTRAVMPRLYERFAGMLLTRGVPSEMNLPILDAYDNLAIGAATITVAARANGDLDPEGFPLLAELMATKTRTEEEEFLLSCRSLADGFATAIAAMPTKAAPGSVGDSPHGLPKAPNAII